MASNKVSVESVEKSSALVQSMLEEAKKMIGQRPQEYVVPEGLSQEEYIEIQKNLQRTRRSTELQLKIHSANFNKESGVEDNTGFATIDRNLGITTLGRKVMRLRGGAGVGEGDSSSNLYRGTGLSNLEKLLGARRVDSHSLMGGSTDFMLKQGDSLLKEIDEKLGALLAEPGLDLSKGAVEKNTTNVLRLRGGASQGSDCDSDGVPGYMQGNWNEDDDMMLIRARREVEDYPILTAVGSKDDDFSRNDEGLLTPRSAVLWVQEQEKKLRDSGVHTSVLPSVAVSASGGIPVEVDKSNFVTVEDYISSEDEAIHVTDQEALERISVHKATKAAFAINSQEREELALLKRKWLDMEFCLQKRGISLVELEKERIEGEARFNAGLCSDKIRVNDRNEFGLPIFDRGNVSGVKDSQGKEKRDDAKTADEVFVDLTEQEKQGAAVKECAGVGVSGVKNNKGVPASEENKVKNASTWSQVVKNIPTRSNLLKFDYVPLPQGQTVVSPPVEVLRKGNEKFKDCVVGSFSKIAMSYGRVSAFAHKAWKKRGLLSVSQKDNSTFIFKFASEVGMNEVLAQGTWYLDKVPMLVHKWGVNVRSAPISCLPLWVKFEQVPDCYWTQEGMSSIASVIGRPLYADEFTSKLDILPFAKICVEYTIGNALPSSIEVMELDPGTEQLRAAEIKVTYPAKPRFCSHCRSLGHIIGACPTAVRHWVKKPVQNLEKPEPPLQSGTSETVGMNNEQAEDPHIVAQTACPPIGVNHTPAASNDADWQTVQRKRAFSPGSGSFSDDSPVPLNTFKNLAKVDEMDDLRATKNSGLSKSQLKKQKKAAKAAKGLGVTPNKLS